MSYFPICNPVHTVRVLQSLGTLWGRLANPIKRSCLLHFCEIFIYDSKALKDLFESMAHNKTVFEGPKSLIEAEGGTFRVNVETLQELSTIDKTLNIVSVVGLYRTGKSYLLTQLAGQKNGFPVGNDTEAMTKGIWAWCVPHPVKKEQQLLLLDTEGLGDIKKGSKTHDNKVFTMAALLSSTLVYNIKGAFDDDALQKLSFVIELAKSIKTSEDKADADGGLLDVFLPEFILVLRDSCLDMKVHGKDATPKEYLEHCLDVKSNSEDGAAAFNEPRLRLRQYFKRRNCFPIAAPAGGRKLGRLATLKKEEIDEDFLDDLSKFLDYVFKKTEPFKTATGQRINGRMFQTLAKAYVDAISKGAVPCIDVTMQAMAEKENAYVVNMAVDAYNEDMKNLTLPTASEIDLLNVHKSAKERAHQIYLDKRVMDTKCTAKDRLDSMIYGELSKIKGENKKLSEEECKKKLEQLHKPIADRFSSGTYFVSGGFSKYEDDIKQMIQTYNECATIGVMKDEAKFRYLQEIEKEKKIILVEDELLDEKAKAIKLAEDAKKREEEAKRMAESMAEMAEKEKNLLRMEYKAEKQLQEIKAKDDRLREEKHAAEILQLKQAEINRLLREGLEKDLIRAKEDKRRMEEQQGQGGCVIL